MNHFKEAAIFGTFLCICITCLGQSVGDYRTKADGKWSDINIWEKYDGTIWSTPSAYPKGSSSNVLISDGSTVTLDVSITIHSLAIGESSAASLQYSKDVSSTLDLYVTGDLIISAGSSFKIQAAGVSPNKIHIFQIDGNISNSGTIDFTDTYINCRLLMQKQGNQQINGSGTFDFYTIEVNLAGLSNVAEFNSLISLRPGGLKLLSGIFKLSSPSTITAFNSGGTLSYTSTAGIWNNGGTINITNPLQVYGLLKLSDGSINIGNTVSDDLKFSGANSRLEISGGTLNISGKLIGISGATMNISGGTINISTKGQTYNAGTATFGIAEGQNFSMSGGNIVIQHAGSSGIAGDLNISATAAKFLNGTITIGYSTGTLGNIKISSVVPLYNLTINAGATAPTLQSNVIVNGTLSLASGVLNLNNQSLTINNAIQGAATIAGTNSSTLKIIGNADVLNFTQGAQILKDLTLSSSSIATLGSKLYISGGTSTNSSGTLTIGAGATLNTNDQLTLGSNQYGTARLAKVDGTIIGKATIERYIPLNTLGGSRTGRAWRLLTAPVSGTSINSAWQEGLYFDGSNHRTTADNTLKTPEAGYGTLITASQPAISTVANENAFDFWPAVAASSTSIRKYTANNTGGNWNYGVKSTTDAIQTEAAYLLFVRGDRNRMLPTDGENATTLRATGIIHTGDHLVNVPPASTSPFTLVGNPYASPIDFESVYTKTGVNNVIKNLFWIWDANLNTYGGYRLIQRTGVGTYSTTPYTMDNTAGTTSAANSYRYIESCAGFFVQPAAANTAGASFTISETDKVSAAPPATTFRIAEQQRFTSDGRYLYVNLNATASSGNYLVDGVTVKMNSDEFNNERDEDIRKPNNFNESLALNRNGSLFMLESRSPRNTDTIFLALSNLQNKTYQLQLMTNNFSDYIAYVQDTYTKERTPIDVSGAITNHNFVVNADAGSYSSNRFFIVLMSTLGVLPLHYSLLKATPLKGSVSIEWHMADEKGITHYELEHSVNGQNFVSIQSMLAQGGHSETSYRVLHQHPVTGINYYRVHSYFATGKNDYSNILTAYINPTAASMIIYPQPVKNKSFWLQLNGIAAGNYQLNYYNGSGQNVHRHSLYHSGGAATYQEQIPKQLPAGIYQLELIGKENRWRQKLVTL